MKLSIQQIYEAALGAGFTPDQATTWTAIALAESGGESTAHNPSGEDSRGLWQINVDPDVRANTWGDLNDPAVNARAAYEISRQGTDMRPWTTTHDSREGTAADYRTYLDQVSAVTGYRGDPRGVAGYGAELPPPLPASGPAMTTARYDEIDGGQLPGEQRDTDHDGLTDAYEMQIGSSPSVADTDGDNLTDLYEVVVSRTSPQVADADYDSIPDATEVAMGTAVPSPVDAFRPAGEDGLASAAPTGEVSGESKADAFVSFARGQRGDPYVFGAEASLDDPDPEAFDCSELTQWAADQVGVTIPDGAMYQYLDLKSQGQLMPVEEALRTKGALLFYFSTEPTPGGGRPSSAHVAISLGDGRTIEARGTSYGVNEFGGAGRFNYAGQIPELSAPMESLETPPTEPVSYDQIDAGLPLDQWAGAGDLVTSAADPLGGALAAAGPTEPYGQQAGLDAQPGDADGDGLSDAIELLLGTDPMLLDSNRDGIADGLGVDLD